MPAQPLRLTLIMLLGLLPATIRAETPPSAPEDAVSARLDAIGRAPSPHRIEADIRKLVSFGTRHTLSDTASKTRGIGAATRWIFDEFTRSSKACGNCLDGQYVRGTVKDGVIEVQGDHVERVIEALKKSGHTVKRAGG